MIREILKEGALFLGMSAIIIAGLLTVAVYATSVERAIAAIAKSVP